MTSTTPDNSYFFRGNHAPLEREYTLPRLEISGTLPATLSGSLYRVGPNPQFAPRDPDYHWFSGDGMVHAFHFDAGRVAYLNRWARTPRWQLEHDAGRSLFGAYGNPRTSDPLAIGRHGGTANTNVVWHAGRLFALEESHLPFELDPHSLASIGYQDFGGRMAPRCTAHPKPDPATGELHFFAYSPDGPGSRRLVHGVLDRDGEPGRLHAFDAPYASMVHDFMLTRRHVLFPVSPLSIDVERAMRGLPLVAWEANRALHVGVLQRGSAAPRWFEGEAGHVFHVMNAWDEGDRVVACVMQSAVAPGLPDADGRAADPQAGAARLCRWTFDLATPGTGFQREWLDDLAAEFPRIDERFTGVRHRHGYYACHAVARERDDAQSVQYDSLAHFDFDTGRRTLHTLPAGDVMSEPVFVPRAANAPEGDGWLLAVAWRARENRSDLLVLDARDLAAAPLALVHLPHRVPFGFHGQWRANA